MAGTGLDFLGAIPENETVLLIKNLQCMRLFDRRKRAQEMGRQRSEEARQLISQKSKDDAKAVFERNSSAGQMNFRRSSSTSVPPPPQISLVQGAVNYYSIFYYIHAVFPIRHILKY